MVNGRATALKRRTVARSVERRGPGVWSGREITVRLEPAEAGHGPRVRRDDCGVEIWLDVGSVCETEHCTVVGEPPHVVSATEHLLSALSAFGITDVLVALDGPEVPLFDGSALPFAEMLKEAGVVELEAEIEPIRLTDPVLVAEAERAILALPADAPCFGYVLDYEHPQIGCESALYKPHADDYAKELAPARTFVTEDQARALLSDGDLKAGSEANAIVVYPDRLSAEPRLDQEFARHKILDIVGDLYLLGRPLLAHVLGYRTGHTENHALARKILQSDPN
ncbi:MAG: UDP-3-O-acyl-N-acetylglucosamine deacetylase [Armatimonadota bacterium]